MVTYYFDNSVFGTALLDERARTLIARKCTRGSDRLFVSGINIAEMAKSSLAGRAEDLLGLAALWSPNWRVIAEPGEILKRSLAARRAGHADYVASLPLTTKDALETLCGTDPSIARAREESRRYLADAEELFSSRHAAARPDFRRIMRRMDDRTILRSANRFIRYDISLGDSGSFLSRLVSGAQRGEDSPGSVAEALSLPEWRSYFWSLGSWIYDSAIRPEHLGGSRRPGFWDTHQSVYLPLADVVITRDSGMYRHLRKVSALVRTAYPGDRCGRVIRYDEFVRDGGGTKDGLLLAQFQEPRGFPVAIRFLNLDEPVVDSLTGQMTTEDFPAILASTFDGDLDALKRLYEGEGLNEFIRIIGLNAFATLVHHGRLSRADLSTYVGEVMGKLARKPSWVWDDLVSVAADFQLEEHREAVPKLYDEGLANPMAESKAEAAARFDSGMGDRRAHHYRLVEDAGTETEWWASFENESAARAANRETLRVPVAFSFAGEGKHVPFARELPKVGRNDPCPCRSGKKFKKCCGQ